MDLSAPQATARRVLEPLCSTAMAVSPRFDDGIGYIAELAGKQHGLGASIPSRKSHSQSVSKASPPTPAIGTTARIGA